MTGPEPAEIGQRARTIRRRRGLSLDVAAGLAGISKSYLGMLENGQRRFERRGLLDDLAAALGASVADLTGQPYLPPDRLSAEAMSTLPGIGLALGDCTLDDVPDVPARPVERLVRLVGQANNHRDQTHYALAGRDLGTVLTELHVHVATGDTDTRRVALKALVEACYVAFTLAKNIGAPDIAALAGRRGYDAARMLGDDPASVGFTSWYRAIAVMRLGARQRAREVLTTAIDDLAPLADPTADDLSTAEAYGFLHLCSAMLAARDRRGEDARDHISEVRMIASRTGERNSLQAHFGPTNTAVWSVAVGVELEDGPATYDRATAEPIDVETLVSRTRVATFHFDLARALAQAEGARDAEAIRYLDMADRIAPQLIRHEPLARELVLDLDARARRRVWELDSLRNRLGVALPA